MGYELYLQKRRISVSSRRYKPTGKHRHSLHYCRLSLVNLYGFEFESTRRFQFSFTNFSLVYRSAFAQIFPRSQLMRESKTSTCIGLFIHAQIGVFCGAFLNVSLLNYLINNRVSKRISE
jgi:hypothetical protein